MLRGSYFWTQVNRPITALTLSTTPTLITEMRENLGQIESRGVSFDAETSPARWLSIIGGYQYADATVTKFSQQPLTVACGNPPTTLIGCRIPQVARNMGTMQVRFTQPRLGVLSLQGRMSGSQYDNDLNTYLLHSYFRLDGYLSHDFGARIEVFASRRKHVESRHRSRPHPNSYTRNAIDRKDRRESPDRGVEIGPDGMSGFSATSSARLCSLRVPKYMLLIHLDDPGGPVAYRHSSTSQCARSAGRCGKIRMQSTTSTARVADAV